MIGKLEIKIKQDMNRWKLVPLSIMGKIDTIRMNVLPRFLFLFKTLPLYISPMIFKCWDRMLLKFIWDDKKPRVKMKTLKLGKARGGLALPDLQDYYYASQIQTIRMLLNDDRPIQWRSIELSMCKGLGKLQPFLGKTPKQTPNNTWYGNTIKAWNKVKKDHGIQGEMFALREIAGDPYFTPNKSDGTFKIWSTKGLCLFGQLMDNTGVAPFETIQRKFSLPHSHFFRYLQVRSYIEKSNIQKKTMTELHPLTQFLIKKYKGESAKHQVSILYKILGENKNVCELREKRSWQDELGFPLSNKDWEVISLSSHKTTASQYWREYAWKFQMRYFLTPIQQAKFQHAITPKCWRDCGEMYAEYSHIFWSCPILKEYWKRIGEEMTKTFKTQVDLSNTFVLLGKTPEGIVKLEDKYLIKILRITAIKLITKNWLQKPSPTIKKWKEMTNQVKEMEILTYKIRGNIKKGVTLWKKWEEKEENRTESI